MVEVEGWGFEWERPRAGGLSMVVEEPSRGGGRG